MIRAGGDAGPLPSNSKGNRVMALRYPIILFFINGPVASVEDQRAAAKLGMGVRFRNATVVPADLSPGAIEKCDGVSGMVPASYSFYPSGDSVFGKWIEARDQGTLEFEFPEYKPPIRTKPEPADAPSLRHGSRTAVEFVPGEPVAPVPSPVPTPQPNPASAPAATPAPAAAPSNPNPPAPTTGWTANPPKS